VFEPLVLVFLFIPTLLISALGEMSWRRATAWAGIALVVIAGLAFFDNWSAWPVDWNFIKSGAEPHVAPSPQFFVFGAVGLFGLWAAARFLDRSPRVLTITATATIAGGMVAVALAIPSATGVIVAAGVWLAAFGAVPSTFQVAALRAAGGSADVAGAFVNATANFGIGAGAALGAVVVAGPGYVAAALTAAIIVGVGLLVILVSRGAFPSRPEL